MPNNQRATGGLNAEWKSSMVVDRNTVLSVLRIETRAGLSGFMVYVGDSQLEHRVVRDHAVHSTLESATKYAVSRADEHLNSRNEAARHEPSVQVREERLFRSTRRPLIRSTKNTIMATTSSKWIRPPPMWRLKPKSRKQRQSSKSQFSPLPAGRLRTGLPDYMVETGSGFKCCADSW